MSVIIAALLGVALLVYLIIQSGAEEVARAMLLVGWGLVPITLFHAVPLFFSALSWRELLPRSSRPGVIGAIWNRWIRESITSLLPVAGVGGDLASARLVHQRGVPGTQAVASMVVDITVGVATQLLFVMIGVAFLLSRSTGRATLLVAWVVLLGIALFLAAIAVFVLIQHRGMFGVSAKLARAIVPRKNLPDIAGSASAIDDAVVAIYTERRFNLSRAGLLRLVGWAAGTGETWLVLQFSHQPLGMIDAFTLESLGAGIRGAAFMVPGALGILEGSSIVFGALFGLPAQTALTIALARRVRELALGIPGLFVWQWVEGHRLFRRARGPG
ncbi:MAG TPA: lysylphosphatidylglycerol synthase domain-containing protein [Stellaceae bacterium]|nr:lysylphosphatidylglycerol synthase domain-containing protein [Stellaceae bacterium]